MIKKATLSDLDIMANLASMLWDNHTIESLFSEIIPKNNSVFFLVFEEQARSDYSMPINERLCRRN